MDTKMLLNGMGLILEEFERRHTLIGVMKILPGVMWFTIGIVLNVIAKEIVNCRP